MRSAGNRSSVPLTRSSRLVPDVSGTAGLADARTLPCDEFVNDWNTIVLDDDRKERALRQAAVGVRIRGAVPFSQVPLHGVILLSGPPGVGKTTLARGLADRLSRSVRLDGQPDWLFLEVDPHALASSALGKSQRSVHQLFSQVIGEQAQTGPTIVLLDEVETLFTDRTQLSMEANPIDVHRAVDAGLVALDALARQHPHLLLIATTNFPEALDPALASRADVVIEVPLPGQSARRAILRSTLETLVSVFGATGDLLAGEVLDRAARASEGLDGRRLRKAVAEACAADPAAQADPSQLSVESLLSTLKEVSR